MKFTSLLDNLRPATQIAVIEAIFRDAEKKFFPEEISGLSRHTPSRDTPSRETVNGVATLCSMAIGHREQLENQLIEWLSTGHEGSIRTSGLRRALIVNFAGSKGKSRCIYTLLEEPNNTIQNQCTISLRRVWGNSVTSSPSSMHRSEARRVRMVLLWMSNANTT